MSAPKTFPCHDCGADLEFVAGGESLQCPYCGAANAIPTTNQNVIELDYHAHLRQAASDANTMDVITVHCEACGANPTLGEGVTADRCPFCASPMVAQGQSTKAIRPQALLPFRVDRDSAVVAFKGWISSLWFAPNALLPNHIAEGMAGVYLPYWTFDTRVTARYRGERGEHYYVTETVTETDAEGNQRQVEKQVQKTRWYPASGTVTVNFDDLMVHATSSLPDGKLQGLEPWDLDGLVDFDARFLAGFRAESAAVGLEGGFNRATERMQPKIRSAINSDIGGDEQRISSFDPTYHNITFKHVLMPVWISAFRFKGKVYRIVVNGRTSEVQGERPFSPWKITIFVLLLIAEGLLLYYYWPAAIVLAVVWLITFLVMRR